MERYYVYVLMFFCCIVVLLISFQREMKKPVIGKEYFNHKNLETIVTNYPYRKNLPEEDVMKGTLVCFSV